MRRIAAVRHRNEQPSWGFVRRGATALVGRPIAALHRTGGKMLLNPGTTCWREAKVGRAALLIDMEAYFDAAMDAMRHAKHSVHLLNWAFEASTYFHPQPGGGGEESDRIGNFLIALS